MRRADAYEDQLLNGPDALPTQAADDGRRRRSGWNTVSSQEAVVAVAYLIGSLILGYAAVRLGQRLGGVDG
jgi:hypothetical protein